MDSFFFLCDSRELAGWGTFYCPPMQVQLLAESRKIVAEKFVSRDYHTEKSGRLSKWSKGKS